MYGDNNPAGSRIGFINGDIDPFHAGGVIKNTTAQLDSEIYALMVVGGSHCEDMGQTSLHDSPSMALAKQGKAALLAKWLK